jgi:uracil-DNA glycosylase family 4
MPLRADRKSPHKLGLKCPLAPPATTPDEELSPFQAHCRKWQFGCGNVECEQAKKIVLMRGKVPCDVAFVGQAPGPSEDSCGQPFVGPAGQTLDTLIEASIPPSLRLAFMNLVACQPYDIHARRKVMEPSVDQVERCLPRLEELLALCRPRLIICVGSQARDWLDPKAFRFTAKVDGDIPRVAITHPSALLQGNVMWKDAEARRIVIALRDAVEEVFGGDHAAQK